MKIYSIYEYFDGDTRVFKTRCPSLSDADKGCQKKTGRDPLSFALVVSIDRRKK